MLLLLFLLPPPLPPPPPVIVIHRGTAKKKKKQHGEDDLYSYTIYEQYKKKQKKRGASEGRNTFHSHFQVIFLLSDQLKPRQRGGILINSLSFYTLFLKEYLTSALVKKKIK